MASEPHVQVIPAVDLFGADAVRLEQGRFDRVLVRRDPLELGREFRLAGASWIHVVDLDGARSGRVRPALVSALAAAAAPARIQASGGVRSPADAERLLAAGAERIVVGTAAFAEADALDGFVRALGDRLVVAIDVREGLLAVSGWERSAPITTEEACARCVDTGVSRVLCTAVERDGTLAGPDLELVARVRTSAPDLALLVAGGIRSPSDVEALGDLGCEAVVVGRALLEGGLPLSALRPP